MTGHMRYVRFSDIDVSDQFFDSLRGSYDGFEEWFRAKANDPAYVIANEHDEIIAFLYLKLEGGVIQDVNPPLPQLRRLKIGTFKIDAHGTRLGERFLKKTFDYALRLNVEEIYVTVFPEHEVLIRLFKRYGFEEVAVKTTSSGVEKVLAKRLSVTLNDVILDYPLVRPAGVAKYLLGIYPGYHSQLLPDSLLNNEAIDIIKDVSHTNSIHKVYVCAMRGIHMLKRGDILVIYRTKDDQGPARYRSVVTSLCVVEEIRGKSSFRTFEEFERYCGPHSVLDRSALLDWYNNLRSHAIKFTYNAAFQKRMTRGALIERVGLSENAYWGFMELSDNQFKRIVELGGVDESVVVY